MNSSIYKKTIKLTESELRNLISESVARILEDMDIDPKNKGKFTATQKRTGKSTEQLCHSKNPLTRKRANFAKMAKRGWKPLNEGIFDMFKKKRNEPTEQNNNEQEQNHVYPVKELQSLCDNQLNITPFEWKVLNAALWVRARQANYHGYAKKWSNIMAKDGELYYWDKGKLKRVP